MFRLFSIALETIAAAPALALIVILLEKHRSRDVKKTAFLFLYALYLAAVFAATGVPTVGTVHFDPTVNLLPVFGLAADARNAALNVILFIPLGMVLPLGWTRFQRLRETVLFGFSLSFAIEFLQLFTFRTSDVNDLLTNTVGTLLGWCAVRRILVRLPHPFGVEFLESILVCAGALAVMVFLQPYLAAPLWGALLRA